MDSKTILKKLDRIEGLPTLPAIAMEINKMLLDYDTSINKLSEKLEKDQAMVSKILKLVNSAFFGLRSKVGNISHAVVLLGFNTIRNAVVSISIIDAFCIKGDLDGFDLKDFWKHSVAVAVTSKYLSEKTGTCSADDCFVGGLLHGNQSFYEAEKNENPVDHARIGGHLAKKWQLPMGVVDAIRYHHTVRPSVDDPNLTMIVHAADIIVNACADDSKATLKLSGIHPDAVKIVGSQLDTVSDWYPDVFAEIESACKFFLEEATK
jgi:HD-like signal output (HDOD) protein